MAALRVATWNLFGRSPERVGLLRLVEGWGADILLLQEADGDAILASERLMRAYPHRFVRRDAGYRPGMAILSRHPIKATGTLDRPQRTFDRARVLWAEVRLPDRSRLLAASVHASAPDSLMPPPYNPVRRNRQLAAIGAFAQGLCTIEPRVVIGGDFNTIRYAIGGMTDAAAAAGAGRPTWRGLPLGWLPPLLRLDRIFVGPGLTVETARVGTEFSGSDHCPVMATVRRVT